MNPTGGYVRTDFGDLVYQAKPYRGDFTVTRRRAADEIAEQMAQFMECHPTYARAEIVAAIPSSATNQPNLPVYLAERLADHLGKENGTDLISKTRSTHPMKDCRTIQEKINNVKGAFALDHQGTARMQDRSIILLDDIYQTGFTLNEVGYVLLASGVREVLGLVATKTAQDLE